jgi:hypothetical protein
MLIFWVVTPCELSLEDGGGMFLRQYFYVYMVLQIRRPIQNLVLVFYFA